MMGGNHFSSIAPGLHVVLGAGPVGQEVAREILRHAGTKVRLVARSAHVPTQDRLTVMQADLSDRDAAVAACASAKTVTFALAPPYTRWPNLFPTLQANAMAGAQAAEAVLVAVENLYGYGVVGRLTEDVPLSAQTRKGAVRAAMSGTLFAAHRKGQVRAVAARASDLFGPHMAVSALGERVWPNLIAGKPIDWLGDPDALHSFTYLPDFARALVRLGAEDRAWGRAWHVPSPPDLSPRQVITRACELAQTPPTRIRRIPKLMLSALGLVSPLMREVGEMAYQFEGGFQMDWSDWAEMFPDRPTDWDTALTATLKAWRETRPA
ncbi:MAG: NAD-dependent epimerase/dehydratase family protein [Pseudomonadota bacterium]